MIEPRPQTLLLWNMGFNAKDLSPEVQERRRAVLEGLVTEHAPSIIALQEAAPDLEHTTPLGRKYKIIEGRKKITSAFLKERWNVQDHWGTGSHRALVVKVDSTTRQSRLWVHNVHIGAHHNSPDSRRTFVGGELLDGLRDTRSRDPDRFELVIGDFNLHPYDEAITKKERLWANRSREWALSQGRRLWTKDRRPLFNATWPLLGRSKPPYGSFYRSSLESEGGPWLVQDQALMSADLALADAPQVDILEHARLPGRPDREDLCKGRLRTPNKKVGSDHLPILIKFRAR
ncbi:MAG: hypothetical protein IT372_00645 [Polyangiaceae bacterium]|nr:hypothetical protein [Polyangiaceae bacterium]